MTVKAYREQDIDGFVSQSTDIQQFHSTEFPRGTVTKKSRNFDIFVILLFTEPKRSCFTNDRCTAVDLLLSVQV